MGSKSKTPPAPDTAKMIAAQQAENQRVADINTTANKYGQVGPQGSSNWSQDPNGQWTATTTLSPEQQALYNNAQGAQGAVAGNLGSVYGKPFDPYNNGGVGPTVQAPGGGGGGGYGGGGGGGGGGYSGGTAADLPGMKYMELQQGAKTSNAMLPQGVTVGQAPSMKGVGPAQTFTGYNTSGSGQTGTGPGFQGQMSNVYGAPTQGQYGYADVNKQTGQATQQGIGQAQQAGSISAGNFNSGMNSSAMIPSWQMVGGAGQGIQKNLDYSKLGALPAADDATRQRTEDALYARQTARLDPQFQASQAALSARLANQGIPLGSRAHQQAMAEAAAAQELAYSGARNDAIQFGGAEQSRLYNMAMQGRQQGVNEINNQGQFANAAQNQGFTQGNTQVGTNNQALNYGLQGQIANNQQSSLNANNQFSNALAAQNQFNQAANQNYANQISGLNLNNNLSQQAYQNQFANTGANNALGQNAYQNQFANTGANNALSQQDFLNYNSVLGANNQQGTQNQINAQSATGFNNAAQKTAYDQSVEAQKYADMMGQQNFANQNTMADFNNKANTQNLTNAINAGTFNNAVGQQGFQNQMTQEEFNNAVAKQNYEQALGTAGQNNAATTAQGNINNNIANNQIGWANAGANQTGANASMMNAGTTANRAAFDQSLSMRNQPLLEAQNLQNYQNSMLPNFSLAGQGAGQVANTDIIGAEQQAYANQLAAQKNKSPGFLGGLVNSIAGGAAGPLGKAAGTAIFL